MTQRKMTKSNSNRLLTGTLAGIAEYLGWSPRILRIGYFVLSILTMHFLLGLWVYLILMVIIPRADSGATSSLFDMFNNFTQQNRSSFSQRQETGRKILHDVEEKDEPKH